MRSSILSEREERRSPAPVLKQGKKRGGKVHRMRPASGQKEGFTALNQLVE